MVFHPLPRRRKVLVKKWLQLRYLLVILGGAALGGAGYAVALQALLQKKIQPHLAVSYSTAGAEDLWLSLYPTVALATLALAVVAALFALFLFKVFAGQVARSSAELERRFDALAGEEGAGAGLGKIPVREFGELAERSERLVTTCRERWARAGDLADSGLRGVGALAGAGEPAARLRALAEFERLVGALREGRPRGGNGR